MAGEGNLVPVYREINADLETPVSAYLKIARPPYSFLLESVEGGEHIARYSFLGTDPVDVIKTGPGQRYGAVDPLIPIEAELSRFKLVKVPDPQRFNGGAVGYLSYEAVNHFERLPSPERDPLELPESVFMMTTTFLIFDHLRHKIRVVSHVHLDGDVEGAYAKAVQRIDGLVSRLESPLRLPSSDSRPSPGPEPSVRSNMTRDKYEDMVQRVKKYVNEGDVIQAVVSQRLERADHGAPVPDIPCPARHKPLSIHVLPGAGRLPHRRGVARATGAGGERRRGDSSYSGDSTAGRRL